jgi:hypothetical protein
MHMLTSCAPEIQHAHVLSELKTIEPAYLSRQTKHRWSAIAAGGVLDLHQVSTCMFFSISNQAKPIRTGYEQLSDV